MSTTAEIKETYSKKLRRQGAIAALQELKEHLECERTLHCFAGDSGTSFGRAISAVERRLSDLEETAA